MGAMETSSILLVLVRRRGLRRRILQQPVKVLYERRDRRPPRLKLKPMLMARKTQLVDATILVEGRREIELATE